MPKNLVTLPLYVKNPGSCFGQALTAKDKFHGNSGFPSHQLQVLKVALPVHLLYCKNKCEVAVHSLFLNGSVNIINVLLHKCKNKCFMTAVNFLQRKRRIQLPRNKLASKHPQLLYIDSKNRQPNSMLRCGALVVS